MRFTFLTAGPEYEFTSPVQLQPLPTSSATILLPMGGREFVFAPYAARHYDWTDPEFTVLSPRRDSGGRYVDVVLREDPVHWFLVWHLQDGTLGTHVREEDSIHMVDTVLSSVEIIDDGGVCPLVLPSTPLKLGTSRLPGYQDIVTFVDDFENPERSIQFTRPGILPASEIHVAGDKQYECGTKHAVDVATFGMDSLDCAALADGIRILP